jgi:adenylosuccinate synthase
LRAYIVVDLGFGDSGKGLLTDFLVRHLKAGLVVRYNGGAQAGHNVVTTNGRHHTFSQFGSGAFNPQVKTYLSRHVVIHPSALLLEGDILQRKGVPSPFSNIRVSNQALVITPYHQAANRIREIVRATSRHGSCGVGVGEAVEDALRYPENRISAGELHNPALLRRKLQSIREQKRAQITELCEDIFSDKLVAEEYEIFERKDVIDIWISSVSRMDELGLIVDDSVLQRWLHEAENVVFEGAQGVLLDADAGFHPYTTWSNCTSANALELIKQMKPDSEVFQIGVMRSYAMRHGPGPLPTESSDLSPIVSEHNQYNEWQGKVRYGWFDAVLARYALSVTGGVNFLAITHMDAVPHLKTWKHCVGYKDYQNVCDIGADVTISSDILTSFYLPQLSLLEKRSQFTQVLSRVTPVLETCEANDASVIQEIESITKQQVGMVSYGPSAEDVQLLNFSLEN